MWSKEIMKRLVLGWEILKRDKISTITSSKISWIEKLGLFKKREQRRSIEESKISLCKGTIDKAISDKVIDSELIKPNKN